LTRGPSRSRSLAELAAEVKRLTAAGYKEIVVTGVHLGAYGRDLRPTETLPGLLRELLRFTGDTRLRLSSIEPMDCADEVLDLVAGSGTIARHFHLPLQHASDQILAAMRRPYRVADYDRLVLKIRRRLPDAAIGTDIITGFPGEGEEDAESVLSYLRASTLTYVHVFPFSPRPGTAAAALPGRVPGLLARERARRVRLVGQWLSLKFRRDRIGTTRRALTVADGSLAVTDNYLKVRIPPGRPRNEWVRVRLLDAGDPINGEVVGAQGRSETLPGPQS
jgi:threonylcarbamoyladenosine tRNA methylthiotransferase MtaB